MTIKTIKALLDACYQAKRVRELLPALPNGVSPSFIQYLDVIEGLESKGVRVKISDISDALDLPRPGVTRTVKEMEDGGYLKKTASDRDGRITYLSIRPITPGSSPSWPPSWMTSPRRTRPAPSAPSKSCTESWPRGGSLYER